MSAKICNRRLCKHKGIAQPLSRFYKNNAYPDNLEPRCIDCSKESVKKFNNKRAEGRSFYKMFL